MKQFHSTTTAEEARILTALCFQAIASGWPTLYFVHSAIQGGQATLDTNRMISDAADMAANLTQAVDHRLKGECAALSEAEH